MVITAMDIGAAGLTTNDPAATTHTVPRDGAVSQGDVKRQYPVPRPAAVLPHSVVTSFGRWLEGGAIIGVQ